MTSKQVTQLDADGYFVGITTADESPLEPGVYLIPAGAIDREPPKTIEPGKRYRTWGTGWRGEDVPTPAAEPEPTPPTPQQIRRGEIVGRLAAIDTESIRALRATVAATAKGKPAPAFDASKLDALETEAATLRAELATLGAA